MVLSGDFIQPLNLETILLDMLVGGGALIGGTIFILIALFFIASIGASFKMSGLLIAALSLIFIYMLTTVDIIQSSAQGFLVFFVIVGTVLLTKSIVDMFNR